MPFECYTENARIGTVGGTLLAILPNITCADYLQTAVLAAVGAAVSFFVSYGLKQLFTNKGRHNKQ